MVDFDWPCNRRDAHGEHLIHVPHKHRTLTPGITYRQGELEDTFWCPGVKAHPATMIGRQVTPEKPKWGLALGRLISADNTHPRVVDIEEPFEVLEADENPVKYRWPNKVIQKIGRYTSTNPPASPYIDLHAPVGDKGERIYCTYKIVGWQGDKALLEKVQLHDNSTH